jgi:8-oxo-dGTP pyrophosphatase MutT (NUDIX family)
MEEPHMNNSSILGSPENPIRSACVVIYRDGKFSAIHHAKRHQVEFAGGKCDPGEAVEACAVREAREELGVEVFNLRPLYSTPIHGSDDRHYFCTLFHADISPDAELVSSSEGRAFWATQDDLHFKGGKRARMNYVAMIMIEDNIQGGLVEV